MDKPLGIDIRKPRLSWELSSSERGQAQASYRVQVAESLKALAGSGPYAWDSGEVASSSPIHVEYQGSALASKRRYYWRVKVKAASGGESDWSEPSYWEMGLLEKSDWKAHWIEPVQSPVRTEPKLDIRQMMNYKDLDAGGDHPELLPCPYIRREFAVSGKVARARLYATAHGLYALELNGSRVGDIEFAPEMTAYQGYLMYQTYDVTPLVCEGANCLGAILADGWWAGRVGMMGDSCHYGDKLGLLAQLEVEYEDGRIETIASDESFKFSDGALRYSDIFIGERYDSGYEKTGWSAAGFDDSSWKAVEAIGKELGPLVAQYGEGVKVVQELKAQRGLVTPKGETVIDFGQIFAGRVRIRVKGAKAGITIGLEHSEILDEECNFLMNIMGRHKDQRDAYVTKGGVESFEPRFTFHGFRYVRVTGYPGKVNPADFTGVVLASALEKTGSFECSDPRLNRLQENILWSQRSNMLSIPTDCPQRERAGWTGDIQIFAPTACFNMDVGPFLSRWLRNVAVDQLPNGEVPMVVPFLKSYSLGELGNSSAGWGDAAVIVPWVLYQKYGDKRVLEENYETMRRWVAYIEKTARENVPEGFESKDPERIERQKYLWNTGFHFGDWLTPSVSIDMATGEVDMMKSAFLTKELIPTCFYAHSTYLMARISKVLGKEAEAKNYDELNRKVRDAFYKEYVGADGKLPLHLQGAYVLALAFDMVPEDKRGALVAQLLDLIKANEGKLDTGFLSVPFLMDVLCDSGHIDVARELLFQSGCPSWIYEVEKGATTMWEAWQAITPSGKVMKVSYNHYAFGCVGDWLYRKIAGFDQAAPGYAKILVDPDLDCGLEWARASYRSAYGKAAAGWKRSDGNVSVDVTVPPSARATVKLRGAKLGGVFEGGKAASGAPGVVSAVQGPEGVELEIGSGSYRFEYAAEWKARP
jgi:alpha-L-rhamnosidase